ncbi:glycoside hydrolase family 3 N-terminal domain-containing protein [Paractinoplanes globisporus]|uniref:Glycoside hydrolase family 3 N-terminal domain-containing protein n=1 Tax=Paractinoplanes globisporus TaxID=113565 RepID=A0ABW6WQC7_9ACTN|nr:glycoside hydrolase family 3 N-terminal domain-containing protein [Actinoplanes globisporus]
MPNQELPELAATVLQPGFVGTSAPDWVRRWLAEGLGGVALFARNVESPAQVAALTAQLRAERPDVIVAIDEEAGDVTRFESRDGSSRPGNLALGAIDDPELTEAVARDLGAELAAAGITLDYAPDTDVNSNPDNPVIGVRAFGAEPRLVARHSGAFIRGLQDAGVAACAKHFPGHGDTSVDSHHEVPLIDRDRAGLEACELLPFRAAIEAGVQSVMTGHLLVPAYDDEWPATLSRKIMTDLLRDELGFDGLIVTDGIEMQGVRRRYGLAGATVRALAAGVDAICVGGDHADEQTAILLRDAIVEAVRTGDLKEERLVDAARRVRDLGAWATRAQTRTGARAIADAARLNGDLTALPSPHGAPANASTPNVSTPNVSAPNVSTPNVSAPNVSAPNVFAPNVSAPNASAANVSAPNGSAANVRAANVSATNGSGANGSGANGSAVNGAKVKVKGSAVGFEAARRAVKVTVTDGAARLPIDRPAHVVEFAPPRNIAIGAETPWGVGAPLDDLLPGTTSLRLTADDLEGLADPAAPVLAGAQGRALVLVARDVHRHPWLATALARVLEARPDAIVVEMGVPVRVIGGVHIATHGATRACGLAAAEVIAGSPVPAPLAA